MAYPLSSLPPTLKALLLITLTATVLAVFWLHLVWLVNFPPSTWFCVEKRKKMVREYDGKKHHRQGKKTRALASWQQQYNGDLDQGITSATYSHTPTLLSQEVRQRVNVTTPTSLVPEGRETQQDIELSSLRRSSQPESRMQSPFTTTVPEDPGLGQLQRRSSAEWLHERAIFFSENNVNNSTSTPTPPPKPNPHPTPSTLSPSPFPTASPLTAQSLSSLDTIDMMQALEEGTAALTSRGRAAAAARRNAKTQKNSSSVLKKSLSWLDQGLGMVDGAVDKVVDKVARWTDDEGGDEPLLLPVAYGRRGIKVE